MGGGELTSPNSDIENYDPTTLHNNSVYNTANSIYNTTTVDNNDNNKTRRLSAPTPPSSSSYSNIHHSKALQGLNNNTTLTSPTALGTTYNTSTNKNTNNNNNSYTNYINTNNNNSSMTLEEIERELIRELHPSMNGGGQNYDRGTNPKKSGVSARSKSVPKSRIFNSTTNNNSTTNSINTNRGNNMSNVIDIDEYINMRKGQNYEQDVLKPNSHSFNNLDHNSDPSPLTDEPNSNNNNNNNNNHVSNGVNVVPTQTLQLSKKEVLVKKLLK